MYKVMVIDDEEMVRIGLRDLIRWEEEGFYVCGEGKDGRDGLEQLLRLQPDVALVDIKMPGLSGLELIRAAREQEFTGEFVILTGFSEFEFAKTAISLGVREYLLKPIDEDELLEIMRKLSGEINRREGERENQKSSRAIVRTELVRKTLLHLEPREKLQEQSVELGLENSGEMLCVAVIWDRELQPGNENSYFLEKAEALLDGHGLYVEKIVMENCMAVIQRGQDFRSWAGELAQRNERLERTSGRGLRIAVGHNVSNWYDAAHSYEFARFLMEHEFLFQDSSVLTMELIEEQTNMAEDPSVDHLCMLIEVGDMEGIRKCAEHFRLYCLKGMLQEIDIRIRVMYNLMKIRSWAEQKYEQAGAWNLSELLDQLGRVERLDDLMEAYGRGLQELCIRIGCAGTDTVIKRMYYYMEKNYGKDLKLESFAEMFHYNSSYLGRIFRREMGDSFNNILDLIRISNAKRLLTQTDLKVYQISKQVGYSNIDYFYMKFRKYVGVSPGEYKKRDKTCGDTEKENKENQG